MRSSEPRDSGSSSSSLPERRRLPSSHGCCQSACPSGLGRSGRSGWVQLAGYTTARKNFRIYCRGPVRPSVSHRSPSGGCSPWRIGHDRDATRIPAGSHGSKVGAIASTRCRFQICQGSRQKGGSRPGFETLSGIISRISRKLKSRTAGSSGWLKAVIPACLSMWRRRRSPRTEPLYQPRIQAPDYDLHRGEDRQSEKASAESGMAWPGTERRDADISSSPSGKDCKPEEGSASQDEPESGGGKRHHQQQQGQSAEAVSRRFR